jgi:polyferredoxin
MAEEPSGARSNRAVRTQHELYRKMALPWGVMLVLFAAAIVGFQLTQSFALFVNVSYLGVFVGLGVGLFIALPQPKKMAGRRVMLTLIGTYIFGLAVLTASGALKTWGGFPGGTNVQLEGLFFSVLSLTTAAGLVHYLIGKIAGPLIFGRIYCGWACWYAMLFDNLPWKVCPTRPPGIIGKGWLRYIHLGASLAVVLVMWFALGYDDPAKWSGGAALMWLLGGATVYYTLGLGVAIWQKDNRAFCKYVCPNPALMKLTSRFAVLKIASVAANCNDCEACNKICPMDVDVMAYAKAGKRVNSTECIMCQACIAACDEDALALSFDIRTWLPSKAGT